MTIAEQLATIDLLRGRPFPAERGWYGGVRSGPGFHLTDLDTSEDFWEDDGSRRPEAEADFEAACEALVALLSRRWGDPEVHDLTGHLVRSAQGEPVPEPLSTLSGFVGVVHAWRVDGRWIGVGVGQQAGELPFQLVVGIGEPESLGRCLVPGPADPDHPSRGR
jgi:hypothetical protein